MATARAVAGATGLAILLGGSLAAQDRLPVVEAVDLLVPVNPAAVTILGRTHIVHELHVTNFLPVEVSLERLQVWRSDPPAPPIADHRGAALDARIGRPGLPRSSERPRVLGPGMRAIVYCWIELDGGAVAPAAVRHRLELEVLGSAGRRSVVVEGGAATVSTDAGAALGPPLRGGPWTAIYEPLLRGGHRTVPYAIDGRARIPGRFAIDWIKLPTSGVFESEPEPAAASDWNGYGSEVLAVADAVVAAARDDVPENPGASEAPRGPLALEEASGNYVALDIGGGRFAFYEHLKRGSVAVKAGDRVVRGQVIGRLGNSGSSSIGPHLHFHVADARSLLAAEGVPFVLTGFDHLGAFTSIDALIRGERWVPAEEPAGARRVERPGPMAVVRFP